VDRKLVLSILAAAVLGFVAIMLFPGSRDDEGPPKLPWNVTLDDLGRVRVLGLTLGQSTLADLQTMLAEEGEINLFSPAAGHPSVESYFEQIDLNGLRADLVVTLDAPQETLAAMYDHGLRVSRLPSGSQRVKLDPADVAVLRQAPIRHLTYLPQARLDEALLERRFGAPAERITEPESGIVHWIYPDRGIDLARDPKGKVVIQYVNPRDLPGLVATLKAQAG